MIQLINGLPVGLSMCSPWIFCRCMHRCQLFLDASADKLTRSETRENGMLKWFLKLPSLAVGWSRTWWTHFWSQSDETSKEKHLSVVQIAISANSYQMSDFFTWIQGPPIWVFPHVRGTPALHCLHFWL